MTKYKSTQAKPDLTTALEALKAGDQKGIPVAAAFYGLTGLTSREIAQVKPVWDGLDADYRRKVMRRMSETSEANFELDYRSMGILGLSDSNSEVREAAIDVLWEDETLEYMERLIELAENDATIEVRAAALNALGRFILLGELGDLPENETVKAQDAALKRHNDEDEDVEVRRRALEAIANSSHAIVPKAIKQAYRSGDRQMRVSSIFAMGRTCDEQWEDIILQELESDDAEMRYNAARAAGELELSDSVRKLARLLTEDDPEIREIVVWSLGEIGGREAIRVLEGMLEVAEEEEDETLTEAIEDALGNANLVSGSMFALWGDED